MESNNFSSYSVQNNVYVKGNEKVFVDLTFIYCKLLVGDVLKVSNAPRMSEAHMKMLFN